MAQEVLVDEHPGGDGGETGGQRQTAQFPGDGEAAIIDGEKPKKNFASGFSTGAPVAIGEHADVVVDGVHLERSRDPRALVDVLLGVGDGL